MIEFHKDHLVPPELCRLLHQVIPKEHHIPVRFHNRRRENVYGKRGAYPPGAFFEKKSSKEPAYIDINLNPVYDASWKRHSPHPWVPSAFIWRTLIETCLHEFGHVATWRKALLMNQHEYFAEFGYGRVYEATEQLASEWMRRRIERILRVDSRLGQPVHLTGYLGARVAKWCTMAKNAKNGKLCAEYVKEARCRKTGGQLTSGNVLMELGINPHYYTNAYETLKRAAEGLGIDYTDSAGRRHKLYTWGDVPLLAERFERDTLKEARHYRSNPEPPEQPETGPLFDAA